MEKVETERKFIVYKPDPEVLKLYPSYTESRITQIYLNNEAMTHRVRRREYTSGITELTENKKVRINGMSAYESERTVSEEEFAELAANIEVGASPLCKTRRTVEIGGLVYEFDSYDDWKETCIMEVEIEGENCELPIPTFVRIVREVTGIKAYSNHSMAHSFPKEEI